MVLQQRQPTQGLQLNTALIGDAVAYTGSFPSRLFSSRTSLNATITGAGPNRFVDQSGAAIFHDNPTASGYYSFGAVQPLDGTNGFTCLVLAELSNNSFWGTFEALIGQRDAATNTQFGLYANINGSANAWQSGAIGLVSVTTAGFLVVAHAAGVIDGGSHCFVCGNSTEGPYIVRDGLEMTMDSSTTLNGASLTNASQGFEVGHFAGSPGTQSCVDTIYLAVMWPRQLPLPLAKLLSVNPWAVFRSRPFVPSKTFIGAAAVPVLSAATASSITATTATPGATLTF